MRKQKKNDNLPPREGENKKKETKLSYKNFIGQCRWNYPFVFSQSHGAKVPASIIGAAYNTWSPDQWKEKYLENGGFLDYWNASQPEPDNPEYHCNATPEVALWYFRKGVPVEDFQRICRVVPGDLLSKISRWEAFQYSKCSSLLEICPSDRKRILRLLSRGDSNTRQKIRMYISRIILSLPKREVIESTGDKRDLLRFLGEKDWKEFQRVLALPLDEVVRRYNRSCKREWYHKYNRLPEHKDFLSLRVETVRNFNMKVALTAKAYCAKVGIEYDPSLILRLINVFEGSWFQYLQKVANDNEKSIEEIWHDAIFWLPKEYSPGFREFLSRFNGARIIASKSDFEAIGRSWNKIPSEKKGSVKDIMGWLASQVYENVNDVSFAQECGRWKVEQEEYETLEEQWLKVLKCSHESIPGAYVAVGKYRMYRLLKEDPRGPFLGKYTDCCQHPSGMASSCAWHGAQDPDGAFFVVANDDDEIVAQSWTWRNGNVICFDNVEAKSIENRQSLLIEIYEKMAKELLGRMGVEEVRVGTGYSDISLPWEEASSIISPPEGIYTDADKHQHIIAKR